MDEYFCIPRTRINSALLLYKNCGDRYNITPKEERKIQFFFACNFFQCIQTSSLQLAVMSSLKIFFTHLPATTALAHSPELGQGSKRYARCTAIKCWNTLMSVSVCPSAQLPCILFLFMNVIQFIIFDLSGK